MNTAFLYIKSRAATQKCIAFVANQLEQGNINILRQGNMQTNDIKRSPHIFHFDSLSMLPDRVIHWFVVQWSEEKRHWASANKYIQQIRDDIQAKWKELGLEKEPDAVHNSIYFSYSALRGIADRMEWLQSPFEKDETGAVIAALGPEATNEAKFWVRNTNVNVSGKSLPAWDYCRNDDTSQLIAKLKAYQPVKKRALEQVTASRGIESPAVPDSDNVFVDSQFQSAQDNVNWVRIKNALRSNPYPLIPKKPSGSHISPAEKLIGTAVTAFSTLARHDASNIDKLFITKDIRKDGRYVFQLFSSTKWKEIVIDDTVPLVNGRIAYISSERGQWWPLLLLKALAKRYGSYAALEHVSYPELMHTLTGKPSFVLHVHAHKNQEGQEILASTNYGGNPSESNFWRKLGNQVLRKDVTVTLVTNDTAPKYGLAAGVPIDIVDAREADPNAKIPIIDLRSLIFKLYRPQNSYNGPFSPKSAEIQDAATRERLNYDDDKDYFFAPVDVLYSMTNVLMLTLMTVDDPVILKGRWTPKGGLPGSAGFRNGPAILCRNTAGNEARVTILLKDVRRAASVGMCGLQTHDPNETILTDDAYTVKWSSHLVPREVAYPARFGPGEQLTIMPLVDPSPTTDKEENVFVALFYGAKNSLAGIELRRPESKVDDSHPIILNSNLQVVDSTKVPPTRLVAIHVEQSSMVTVTLKQLLDGVSSKVPTFAHIVVYKSNTSEKVASMDNAYSLREVHLTFNCAPGSYDIAAQISKTLNSAVVTVPIKLSICSEAIAEMVASACRNIKHERLSDARMRELSVGSRDITKRHIVRCTEGAFEKGDIQDVDEL